MKVKTDSPGEGGPEQAVDGAAVAHRARHVLAESGAGQAVEVALQRRLPPRDRVRVLEPLLAVARLRPVLRRRRPSFRC